MKNKVKNNQKSVSRRNFFKVGLGAAGTLAAGHSLAQVCGLRTAPQALGPFFPSDGTPQDPIREDQQEGLPIYLANDNDLTFIKGRQGRAQGQVVYIEGTVKNEDCQPLTQASLFIWQASKSGRYNHKGDAGNPNFKHPLTGEVIERSMDPFFQYWGHAVTDDKGKYQFKTVVPGFYPADLRNGWYRPPHIHFMVAATGYPQFVTQMYFQGEKIIDNEWIQQLNEKDFLLQNSQLTDRQRQDLVVNFKEDPTGVRADGLVGQFDLVLEKP